LCAFGQKDAEWIGVAGCRDCCSAGNGVSFFHGDLGFIESGLALAINKNKINDNALKFIQKGQIKKAIREYEKILSEDPSDVRTLLKKGDLLVRVGDKQQAVETYLVVASTYSQQGFHLKAVAVFKQILKIDDSRIDVNLRLADEYQNLGIIGDAMSHLQIVAGHYEQQQLTRESLNILRRIVDLDPDNIASRIKLAEMYSREEMVPEAVEEFGRAAEDLKTANRIEDFVKVAERLIYHDSANIVVIKELANIYLQRGDTKRALGKLQICFKSDPRDLEILGMLAMAFQELNQLSKTVSVYKEMAKIYEEQGAVAEMQQTYQRVLEIMPDDPDANQALGGSGQTMPAEADFQQADPQPTMQTESVSDMPMLENELDEPYDPVTVEQSMDLDEPLAVEDDFDGKDDLVVEDVYEIEDEYNVDDEATIGENLTVEEVVSADQAGVHRSNEDAREEVSRLLTETEVYIKYGLQNKAFDHLSKIFQLDPNNIEAHEKLKDIYISADQTDHAAQELLTLAHLNNQLGRLEEARSHIRALLTIFPDHGEGLALANEIDGQAPVAAGDELVAESLSHEFDQGGPDVLVVDQDNTVEIGSVDSLDAIDDMSIDVETDDLMDEDEEEAPTMIADRAALDFNLEQDSADSPAARLETNEEQPFDDPMPALDYDNTEATVEASVIDTGVYPGGPDEFLVQDDHLADSGVSETIEELNDLEEPEIVELVEETETSQSEAPVVRTLEEDELIEFTADEDDFFSADEQPRVSNLPPPPPPPPDIPDLEAELPEDLDSSGPAAPIMDNFDASEMSTQVGMSASAARQQQADQALDAGQDPTADAADLEQVTDLSADSDIEVISDDDFESISTGPEIDTEQLAEAAEPEPESEDEDLEDALEEIDFFIQQNLMDEAIDELERLKQDYPDNPEVQERLAKVEKLSQGEALVDQLSAGELEGPFDLAAEIEREAGDDVAPVPLDEDFQYSFDDVFSEFKKGIEKVVDKEDSATHFDLGIAYKEMGLVDDAVNEFMIAAHDDSKRPSCLNMMGICFQEKGQYSEAINRFKEALHGPGISDQEATGVYYEMGRTYELLDDMQEALFYYKKVYKRDDGFRDVKVKLQKIIKSGSEDKQGNDGDKQKKPASSKSNISYM